MIGVILRLSQLSRAASVHKFKFFKVIFVCLYILAVHNMVFIQHLNLIKYVLIYQTLNYYLN